MRFKSKRTTEFQVLMSPKVPQCPYLLNLIQSSILPASYKEYLNKIMYMKGEIYDF